MFCPKPASQLGKWTLSNALPLMQHKNHSHAIWQYIDVKQYLATDTVMASLGEGQKS